MTESGPAERQVYEFILDNIDSVPHLEALLLLWNSRPQKWCAEEVAKRLYVDPSIAQNLLDDLSRAGLIVALAPSPERQYHYESKASPSDALIEAVDSAYRRQVVRISTLIHSKASSAVRDFARAFRFTKEKEKD
jgi:DNA-binding MurR/RpiR family transcriptional regulator